MRTLYHVFFAAWLMLFGVCETLAVDGSPVPAAPDRVVTARAVWSLDGVRPGGLVVLAVVFDMDAGFHINADEGQIRSDQPFRPIPTRIEIRDSSGGIVLEGPLYPEAVQIETKYSSTPVPSFTDGAVIYLPVKVDHLTDQRTISVQLAVSYQACDDTTCRFPQTQLLSTEIPIVRSGAEPGPVRPELFRAFSGGTPEPRSERVTFDLFGWSFVLNTTSWLGRLWLLLIAAVGGALLNLTPCVLPMIPIKVLNLSRVAQNREQCLVLGAAMFLGVTAFWAVLGLMMAMISEFVAVNQLFQYPWFTIVVGVVIGLMGIWALGLFNRGLPLPGFVYRWQPSQETRLGSFGLGLLTAVLSTPCTAPFMGAAAAWAAVQTPGTTLAAFTAIGVGMALPYLILSNAPALLARLPRSGPGSQVVKEVMGVLILAAAAYFIGGGLSSLGADAAAPPSKTYWWAVMGLVGGAGLWLAVRIAMIARSTRLKLVGIAAGFCVAISAVAAAGHLADPGPIDWVYYTPQRFEAAAAEQKVIVAVFTAEWCLNCKALEKSVLHQPRVVRALNSDAVVPVKVDITGNNPEGKAKLKSVGRVTIPLLIVYAPGGRIVLESDFYTAGQLLEAIETARNPADLITEGQPASDRRELFQR